MPKHKDNTPPNTNEQELEKLHPTQPYSYWYGIPQTYEETIERERREEGTFDDSDWFDPWGE